MNKIILNHLNFNYQEIYFYWFQHSMKEQYSPLVPSEQSKEMWFTNSKKYDSKIISKFNVLYDISDNRKHITRIDKTINFLISTYQKLVPVFNQKKDAYYQFGNLFTYYNDRMLRIYQTNKYYDIINESKKDLIKNLRKHHYENFRKFLELSPNYEVIYHKLKDYIEINFHISFDDLFFDLFFCKHIILTNIILYDQFSRVIKRNTKESYKYDYVTKTFSEKLMKLDIRHLIYLFTPPEFMFLILPFQHYEDKTLDTVFLALKNTENYEKEFKLKHRNFVYYSKKNNYNDFFKELNYHNRGHYDVLSRFGRYPKRNKVIGRLSTPDENTYIRLTPNIPY